MSLQTTALKIIPSFQSLLQTDFEIEPAQSSDFAWLHLQYYDNTQQTLEELGYRKIDDIELTAISRRTPNQRTFIRRMLSTSGTTHAGIFNVRIKGATKITMWLLGQSVNIQVIEFDTEFSDGHFMTTKHTTGANAFVPPPTNHALSMPSAYPIRDLATLHESRVNAYLEQNPTVKAIVCATADDLTASGKRQTALKVAFRKSIGGVTKPELRALAKLQSAAFVDQLHVEVVKQMAPLIAISASDEQSLASLRSNSATPTCSCCGLRLGDFYYLTTKDQVICQGCKHYYEPADSGVSWTLFWNAFFKGSCVMIFSAIVYYSIRKITGYEIGLLALLVGLLIGSTVRRAAGPEGGLHYQVLAASLTYCAIALSYIPASLIYRMSMIMYNPTLPLAFKITFICHMVFIVMTLPFRIGMKNILGLCIMGFAIFEAWKLNRFLPQGLRGPYKTAS